MPAAASGSPKRSTTGTSTPRSRARSTHQAGDRILILTDTDGDGRADSSKVFVQDKDLRAPLGLAVIGNRVVVSASPHLIVYTDENGDDKPDKKEILLSGFGGFDHDHGLHALVAGPDGRWYFNTGNAGPHVVTDRSGWTLRAGSLYTGGTPYNLKNEGGMVSDDGRVWTGGLGLRMEPDGTRLTVLAHNFRNAYELAVDSFGDLWQNDNDDQVMACRMTWLMEGAQRRILQQRRDAILAGRSAARAGHVHGALASGRSRRAACRRQHGRRRAGWRRSLRGRPARRSIPRPAPQRRCRPERDLRILPKPQRRGIRARALRFRVEPRRHRIENYIWNRVDQDRRKWFRPSDVAVGADGAIYVADWYDPIVGGHQMHDGKGYGRIYRVTPKGRSARDAVDRSADDRGSDPGAAQPGGQRAEQRLRAAEGEGQPRRCRPSRSVLADPNPYHRARAIWLLAQLGPDGVREVERLPRPTRIRRSASPRSARCAA